MQRYVAFLRGMNLGNRRIKNPELCEVFAGLGLGNPTAFLASGNVVFDTLSEEDPATLAARIETALESSLGYAVPTFLRASSEVRDIAAQQPFPAELVERSTSKPQVVLLDSAPGDSDRAQALDLATEVDRLVIRGREIYWLPDGGVARSELDFGRLERHVGRTTVRTQRTLVRIVAKFLDA